LSLKRVIERWKGVSLEHLLRSLYIEKNLSMDDIAKELSVSIGVVHRWLNQYGISKQKELWK